MGRSRGVGGGRAGRGRDGFDHRAIGSAGGWFGVGRRGEVRPDASARFRHGFDGAATKLERRWTYHRPSMVVCRGDIVPKDGRSGVGCYRCSGRGRSAVLERDVSGVGSVPSSSPIEATPAKDHRAVGGDGRGPRRIGAPPPPETSHRGRIPSAERPLGAGWSREGVHPRPSMGICRGGIRPEDGRSGGGCYWGGGRGRSAVLGRLESRGTTARGRVDPGSGSRRSRCWGIRRGRGARRTEPGRDDHLSVGRVRRGGRGGSVPSVGSPPADLCRLVRWGSSPQCEIDWFRHLAEGHS